MAEDDKILDFIKYSNAFNNRNKGFFDKIETKDILLFLGGIAVGYGIKTAVESETFKSAANNTKIMIKNHLDHTTEYQEPSDDDVEVYIMSKDGE